MPTDKIMPTNQPVDQGERPKIWGGWNFVPKTFGPLYTALRPLMSLHRGNGATIIHRSGFKKSNPNIGTCDECDYPVRTSDG